MTKDLSTMEKPHLEGYIVLGWDPASGKYLGYVENSFSMSVSTERTQFHWSGTAYSNFGTTHQLDGSVAADREIQYLSKEYPQYQWEKYDVHDSGIPVHLDWDEWRADSARDDKKLSGVVSKYGARNPRFEVRPTLTANTVDQALLSAAVAFVLIAEKARYQANSTKEQMVRLSLMEIDSHCKTAIRIIDDARKLTTPVEITLLPGASRGVCSCMDIPEWDARYCEDCGRPIKWILPQEK